MRFIPKYCKQSKACLPPFEPPTASHFHLPSFLAMSSRREIAEEWKEWSKRDEWHPVSRRKNETARWNHNWERRRLNSGEINDREPVESYHLPLHPRQSESTACPFGRAQSSDDGKKNYFHFYFIFWGWGGRWWKRWSTRKGRKKKSRKYCCV